MAEIKLLSKKVNPVSLTWLAREWRHIFEDHLPLIKKQAKPYEVKPELAREHAGDFYAYLASQGLPKRMFWYYLRINDMHDPSEFSAETTLVWLIDPPAIQGIENRYLLEYQNAEGTNY